MRRTILSLTPPLREALRGPQLAIFALALALALAWLGVGALLLALPFALIALISHGSGGALGGPRSDPGQSAEMAAMLDRGCRRARREGRAVLFVLLGVDGFRAFRTRHGVHIEARIATCCLDHLSHELRAEDALFDLGEGRFGIVLLTDAPLSRETADGITQRLRAALQSALATTLPGQATCIRAGVHIPDPCAAAAPATLLAQGLAALGTRADDDTDPASRPDARLRTRATTDRGAPP